MNLPQEEVAFTILTGPVIYTETANSEDPFEDIEESKQEHVEVSKNGWFGIIQHYYVERGYLETVSSVNFIRTS